MSPDNLEGIDRSGNEAFHWRLQRLRRLASVLAGLILLVAALGLFGSGPLNSASKDGATFRVEYARLLRKSALSRLTLRMTPIPAAQQVDVSINVDYLEAFDIEGIAPEPRSSSNAGGTWIYRFSRKTGEGTSLVFLLRPNTVGNVRGTVTVGGAETISIHQFIFP